MTRYCFVPDEKEVFKVVQILSSLNDDFTVCDLNETSRRYNVPQANTVPIGSLEELENPPTDLIKLIQVHRPGILHTLRTRFFKNQIYTSIGPILVALNPFKWISGVYGEEIMKLYKSNERNLSEDPHVFAIAHEAYCDLSYGQNQSLIISGESGAGKTEATKQCLNYLAYSAGSASGIQSKILKASPILEGWGNAKTLRNNNSSRFGKFIEIWFDKNNTIVGSSNTTYILEKSRVIFQEKDERNYHIFYQLLKGGTPELLQEFHLVDMAANPNIVQYINQSGCIAIDDVDDRADFLEAREAFVEIGFTSQEEHSLYQIIAGILHFGNISFESNPRNSEESLIVEDTKHWLTKGCQMFGIDVDLLTQALLYKKIKGGGKRTSVALASYLPPAAMENKNALTKEIYRRCFDFIVNKVNTLVGNDPTLSKYMIGILDIFGFEIFQKNSFEQLCINLANEALQQHFNYNIFQAEMDTYLAEDVPVPKLDFKDNQDVLDLIVKRPKGLIPMLDEEGVIPKGSWEGFLSKFTKQYTGNPRFKAKTKTNELGIVHYAGEVYYDPSLFLVKNKDTLSQDLVDVFAISTQPLVSELFQESFGLTPPGSNKETDTPNSAKVKRSNSVETKMTVGRKFSLQLESLIANLNSTKPRYIRCIKPNQVKKPDIFVPGLTNEQLTYSGVFEAVIIMQNGYPFRLTHQDFRSMYHMLLIKNKPKHNLLFNGPAYAEYVRTNNTIDIKSVKVKSKAINPFTREQCSMMVQFLTEELNENELTKCFVGITKTFYQSKQHRILQLARQIVLSKTIQKLQKVTRGYNVRKIMYQIDKIEKTCTKAIQERNIVQLKESGKELEMYIARLNALSKIHFTMKISTIAVQYGEMLEQEKVITKEIYRLLTLQVEIMEKYDDLERNLELAKNIKFSAVHKGIKLELNWEQNPTLLDYAHQIDTLGVSVKIKRAINEGIATKNEVMLEKAITDLKKLRMSGEVDSKFCANEETEAKQIIKTAEEMYDQFLDAVLKAIDVGKLSMKRRASTFELDITVDSKILTELVTKYTVTAESSVDSMESRLYKSSKRVRMLLDMCTKLRDLRLLSEQSKWQEVWDLIQTNWKNFIKSNGEEVVPESTGNNNNNKATGHRASIASSNDEIFVPPAIRALVLAEIKEIAVSSINYFIVPKLNETISHNGVPEVPYFGKTGPNIDMTELKTALALAQEYSNYFDESLVIFINRINEHLHIREVVMTGNQAKILDLLDKTKYVQKTHKDYIHMEKYRLLNGLIQELSVVIMKECLIGEPGTIEFSQLKPDHLSDMIQKIEKFPVHGDEWAEFMSICDILCTLRQHLYHNRLREALNHIESLTDSTIWKTVNTKLQNKTIHPLITPIVNSIMEEVKRYSIEIIHWEAVNNIVDSLNVGAAVGEIGSLKLNPVVGDKPNVSQTIERVKNSLIKTVQAEKLLRDCQMITELRVLFGGNHWVELEKIVDEFYANTNHFVQCHEACRHELFQFYDEVHDKKIREHLLEQLKIGQITVLLDTELLNRKGIKTIAMKKVIDYALDGYKLASVTKNMLLNAQVVYALRKLMHGDIWEPDGMIYFNRVPTAGLEEVIPAIEIDPIYEKEAKQAVQIIDDMLHLDDILKSSLAFIQKSVEASVITELSVAHVLCYIQNIHTIDYLDMVVEELEHANKLIYDRRCKALLLLAASTGQTKGNLETLHYKLTKVDGLQKAIDYVSHYTEYSSSLVKNWTIAAKELLKARRAVIQCGDTLCNDILNDMEAPLRDPADTVDLMDLLVATDLLNIMDTTTNGFPLAEITLIYHKLNDLASVQELSQAMNFGAPSFSNGKFDVSRVQYDHLLLRIDVAKKLKEKSDRLDRLFFYSELCMNLRIAVSNYQWDLSAMGEKTVIDRTIVTVKPFMLEYEQAKKVFRTPVQDLLSKRISTCCTRMPSGRKISEGIPSLSRYASQVGKSIIQFRDWDGEGPSVVTQEQLAEMQTRCSNENEFVV